jgi:1-acyl-sn-glycerol-3-phosphate acyltransferase
MNRRRSSEYNARARTRPFAFYPPKTSPLVVRLVKQWLPRAMRRQLKVTEVEISDEDLTRLKELKGKRCLLTPSHSGGYEPHIILHLSKLTDDIFNFVAAIEVFEQAPINRWLMPRLGCYSITRGALDRPSFAMTRQLLAEGKRWLVIFPEGHAIWQNSILAPFQQGVMQLAFRAFEDATEADAAAHLYCVPIAIKYVYLEDMHDEIDASLARLRGGLAMPASTKKRSRYEQLREIAEAVLVVNEKVHHVKSDASMPMNDRIQNLKELVTAKLERQLDIVPTGRQTLLDRIRALFNAVDRTIYEEASASVYEQRMWQERRQIGHSLYEDLWRLLQFVAIYDGYVRESMTVERFMDVLCLLEMEVFKKRRIWGPRKACVRVGEPIDLREHATAYADDKRGVVQNVNSMLESRVQEMLHEMGAKCAEVRE